MNSLRKRQASSEEELRKACEEIGPVVSLQVATDEYTGKSKGFAFCEYLDDETASSACRNLNGHVLLGRALRVSLAVADRQQQQQGAAVPLHERRRRGDEPDQPVGMEDATHAASLLSGALPNVAVTAYLGKQTWRQLREMLELMEAQGDAVMEQTKREYAGLATLIEQAHILLDMALWPRPSPSPRRRSRKRGPGP
ncbi:hypothetical protein GUJ93_ZPchr0006g42571 [Zizania palustris]|uniref:RRM domain-containing protein n=1 Tax=Zizania palustris TaxID=103762 RepID=A0A8J5T0K1_ZIZPA|nr:hypothetical protein GUJ93_ZPchr0006g42571 [Zizania palustris]